MINSQVEKLMLSADNQDSAQVLQISALMLLGMVTTISLMPTLIAPVLNNHYSIVLLQQVLKPIVMNHNMLK